MYKKVDTTLDFVRAEAETLAFWKERDIFGKTVKQSADKPPFTFYDGPPTANGKPHIGHILTRVVKDIIPRYKVMKGYSVLRKAGWDTHGLPVELEVEKLLKLDGKQDIEKYGIEPFIKQCKESVWKYKGEWERMSDRVGYWMDMDDPYITYDNQYIESVWWAIKTISDKGLLYKGHKIVPYCPRCGTALSTHEVAQGYKDVKDASIFVAFKKSDEQDTYFLAWTTTPWTLPSNVALAVSPKENYAKVRAADGRCYILAESLVPALFGEGEAEILGVQKGKAYEFTAYDRLFDFAPLKEKHCYVTCADFVTLTDGTGIVHIAPAFGEDDSAVGRAYGLPFLQLVDDRGRFKAEAAPYAGVFCKHADKQIIADLKARGLVFSEKTVAHSYPFCWRCDTPLLYYARASWFIAMSKVKDALIRNNNSVNWMPDNIKAGRMGNFLENILDWGLSRERYWGTPLPVWVCADCGKTHVVGSIAELDSLTHCGGDIELHRPYVDALTFPCGCGGTFRRTPEVIDCWFDSGAMPFAQHHYPFENKARFERTFPADFISEAVDQTRGWFYTLLAISTLLFDKAPFKNCIVLGHVTDKNGLKMSKHKGNVVDPWTVLDKQGADAVRWYFYAGSAPWLSTRFYPEAVDEAQRKFMGTLWNTYAFFVLYADIDKYDPSQYGIDRCTLTVMDKWILSELNSLTRTVSGALDAYDITNAARAIGEFTDGLSNWYVRRCRERFWGKGISEDKAAAFTTLYTVLRRMCLLTAPFVPFMAESMYQNLVPAFFKDAPESVHLNTFPDADEHFIDAALESVMHSVLSVVALGRAARAQAGIKNRQPIAKMLVAGASLLTPQFEAVVLDELNVKTYEKAVSVQEFSGYDIKPQLKTLGPKYGKLLNAIRQYLADCDSTAVVETVRSGGVFTVTLEGTEVSFSEEDLLISARSKPGFAAASDRGVTVVLDTALTEELITEGFARELVSKIQTMRKDSGFGVTDRIALYFKADGRSRRVLLDAAYGIAEDVLAISVTEGSAEGGEAWRINGEDVLLRIRLA